MAGKSAAALALAVSALALTVPALADAHVATAAPGDAQAPGARGWISQKLVTPLTVVESSVGHVHTHGVSSALRLLLDLGAIPRINAILGAGMPIPPVDGVSFERLALTIDDGALTLRTDLSYSPTETRRRAAQLISGA